MAAIALRYVVHGGGNYSQVVDTTTRKSILTGSFELCNSTAETLNQGFAVEFERTKGMLTGVLRPIITKCPPQGWHVTDSDVGASVVTGDGTVIATTTDGNEALALCRLARQLHEELMR